MNDDWARAFVARVAAFDRLAERRAESGLDGALEESALTLDVLIRDARIALGVAAAPVCVNVTALGIDMHERRYGGDFISRHRPQDCDTDPPRT